MAGGGEPDAVGDGRFDIAGAIGFRMTALSDGVAMLAVKLGVGGAGVHVDTEPSCGFRMLAAETSTEGAATASTGADFRPLCSLGFSLNVS